MHEFAASTYRTHATSVDQATHSARLHSETIKYTYSYCRPCIRVGLYGLECGVKEMCVFKVCKDDVKRAIRVCNVGISLTTWAGQGPYHPPLSKLAVHIVYTT